jgi:glycosyltransferase 2 family protein
MDEDAASPARRHAGAAAKGRGGARRYATYFGRLLFSCAFGGALLWALHRGGAPLIPDAATFAQVRWWTLPVYVTLLAVSAYFRAVRWRLLLRPLADVSAGSATSAVMVGTAAVLLLPLRLGEMVRPYLIARDRRVPLLGALGTVVAERIIDGLVLSLILAAALLFVPAQVAPSTPVVGLAIPISVVRGYAWTFLMVFATALTVIVIFHVSRERSVGLTRRLLGKLSPRFGEYVAGKLDSFGGGLDFFRHRRLASQFLVETGVYWGTAALAFWLLAWSVGVAHGDGSSMTFGEACAVMGVLSIASVLPGPPGLLGLFQSGAYAAMTMYFPTDVITGAGSAYVFLLYVLQMSVSFAAAGTCLLVAALGRRRRSGPRLEPAHAREQTG